MVRTKTNKSFIGIVVSVILLFFIIYFAVISLIHMNETTEIYNATDLEGDGVKLCKSVIPPDKIKRWRELNKNRKFKELKTELHTDENIQRIVKSVSPEYVLQDYIWIIQKSAVHTCHRDNNGTFFNTGQKHDSYTMLVYLESMDKCLGVVPGSHKSLYKNAINFTGGVNDVVCSAGDVILFNANLIHVGTITEKDDNLRIQMKVSHPDDLDVLSYYQNYNKVLNKDNTLPNYMRRTQRTISCSVPFISDMTQSENIKSARGTDNGAEISTFQKIFSWVFYGKSDFYDLPNVF